MNWDNVDQFVKQLIDEMDWCNQNLEKGEKRFQLDNLKIYPMDGSLKVALFDKNGKPFKYAIYIDREGRAETDGY